MFAIELRSLKSISLYKEYVELVDGQIAICGWECLPDRYRFWTSDEADVFIMWEQDRAASQGMILIKREA